MLDMEFSFVLGRRMNTHSQQDLDYGSSGGGNLAWNG